MEWIEELTQSPKEFRVSDSSLTAKYGVWYRWWRFAVDEMEAE